MNKTLKIMCPNCRTFNEVATWSSLNSKISPRAKKKLLKNKLFEFKCKQCKKTHQVAYNMLYHDPVKKLLFYLETEQKNYNEIKQEISTYIKLFGNDYTFRVVRSDYELIEKIMIFDNNLNDKVVEFLKYVFETKVIMDYPNLIINKILLCFDKHNKMHLDFYGNRNCKINIELSDYHILSNDLMQNFIITDDLIIDINWAKQLKMK